MKPKLKFKYHSPRNDRLKNRGLWIGVYDKNDSGLRYSYMYATKRWEIDGSNEYKASMSKGSSNKEHCKSFRKFKKRLRKQPELIGLADYEFRLYRPNTNYVYTIESVL